ncbi:tyrosine-type recombinase/integrase [Enterococcus hirae]|uniref:tyrosine-type recombinase/integrase n=1 Tax=Enterococcus hirae TaxID=1354 RepID=UPI0013716820|nr:site-specific integrase [Enterococcus hirae]NAE18233.1 tyrosine-type recombinase/integrase [Enterococcus hirae]
MPKASARRQRGDGALYQRADGLWVGVVDLGYGGDGKRKRRTVSSMSQATALKKLRDLRRTVADHGDAPNATLTLEKWLARWLEDIARYRVRPRTYEGYQTCVTQHIVPVIGRKRLAQLAPQHVREMQTELRRGNDKRGPLAETTILKAHRVLAKALGDAQREGLVMRNVATLVDAPRKGPSPRRALTSDQAKILMRATQDDPMCSRWMAALFTGARQGELLGLEWNRVSDVLDLSWQLQRIAFTHGCGPQAKDGWPCGRKTGGGCPQRSHDLPPHFEYRTARGGLLLTRPKTSAGTRIVVMAQPLQAVMTRHWELQGKPTAGLVWTTQEGYPITPRDDWDAWQGALAEAGLPPIELHSARHTTATLLLEAGVDAHVISSILGHSDIVVTRSYQHVDLTLQQHAMAALAQKLAAVG